MVWTASAFPQIAGAGPYPCLPDGAVAAGVGRDAAAAGTAFGRHFDGLHSGAIVDSVDAQFLPTNCPA